MPLGSIQELEGISEETMLIISDQEMATNLVREVFEAERNH